MINKMMVILKGGFDFMVALVVFILRVLWWSVRQINDKLDEWIDGFERFLIKIGGGK